MSHTLTRRAGTSFLIATIGGAAALAVLATALNRNSVAGTTAATAFLACTSLITLWRDRKRSYPLLAFVACFIVFLVGRQTLNLFVGAPASEPGVLGTSAPSDSTMIQTNLMLFIALAGINAGWLICAPKPTPAPRRSDANRDAIRRASGFLLACTTPFTLYSIWRAASSVSEMGFYSGRLTSSGAPIALRVPAALFELSFFAYISASPDRRRAIRACALYLLVGIASLATLARADFVLSLGIVSLYLYHRQATLKERWFTPRRVIATVMASPLALLGLNTIGSLRGRAAASSEGIFAPVYDFVRGQGVSVKVIVFTQELSGYIPDNRWYSFGPLIEFFQRIVANLTGATPPDLRGQTAERAIEGHQLAHTISYLIAPNDYLRGTGYGSSYVAELFVDFGLLGVFLGSAFYGYSLTRASGYLGGKVATTFIALMLIKGSLFVPRASFVQPLVDPFSTPSLLAMPILAAAIVIAAARRPQVLSHNVGRRAINKHRTGTRQP